MIPYSQELKLYYITQDTISQIYDPFLSQEIISYLQWTEATINYCPHLLPELMYIIQDHLLTIPGIYYTTKNVHIVIPVEGIFVIDSICLSGEMKNLDSVILELICNNIPIGITFRIFPDESDTSTTRKINCNDSIQCFPGDTIALIASATSNTKTSIEFNIAVNMNCNLI